jgi:hypothetical protein
MGGRHHTPSLLPLRKAPYHLYRGLGWAQGRSAWLWKILPPLGYDSVCPNHSKSLYQLCYMKIIMKTQKSKLIVKEL